MRIKQVGAQRWVARCWIYQSQEYARNSRGNMYFKGRILYSYSNQFPLAALVGGGRPTTDVVVLSNSKGNIFTNMHRQAVVSAIRTYNTWDYETGNILSGYPTFHAPLCAISMPYEDNINQILEFYKATINERALKLKRARKYRHSKYRRVAISIREALDLAKFFGVENFDPGPTVITKEQLELYRMSIILEGGHDDDDFYLGRYCSQLNSCSYY